MLMDWSSDPHHDQDLQYLLNTLVAVTKRDKNAVVILCSSEARMQSWLMKREADIGHTHTHTQADMQAHGESTHIHTQTHARTDIAVLLYVLRCSAPHSTEARAPAEW